MNNYDNVAPIYIPTLCRYNHLKRAIESLKANTWEKYTTVYIALDYPANYEHVDGYKKICTYLESNEFSEFREFIVFKRSENMGPSANSSAARNDIMERYDRWIFAEDDIEFSPIFLEYMNRCLDYFSDDPSIFAINGYSYDIKWKVDQKATVLKQKETFSAWGVGYWKDKYVSALNDLKNNCLRNHFNDAVKSGRIKNLIAGRYCDYVEFALSGNKNSLYQTMSDVSLGIYLNLKDLFVITPVVSKTRNYGFDGSGVYCSRINKITDRNSLEYDYTAQFLDENLPVDIIVDRGEFYIENKTALSDFLYVSKGRKRKVAMMMAVYHVLGQRRCERIYQALKYMKNTVKEW